MTDVVSVTKLNAAQRQLDRAIRMLFTQDDPVCTHTLAGAASILFTDLVEHHLTSSTWEQKAQEDNGLGTSQFFGIARKAQNFLKHARNDTAETLDFDPNDTDALLTLAVFNASELAPLSPEAQVFQLWSLAMFCPDDLVDDPPFKEAIAYFTRLKDLPRSEKLAAGLKALYEFAPVRPNPSLKRSANGKAPT